MSPNRDDIIMPDGDDDAAQDQAGADDPTEALDQDLRKLQDERESLFQQLARVQADFRNARQRLESEKQQQIQYANASLLKNLLPVIDNFQRALEVDMAKTDVQSLVSGMRIVYDQLMKMLQSQSVQEIAPQPGDLFDPNQHEALMQQPSDQYREPTVTQLYQKGYSLHGRVLRPAQVVVAKSE